MKTKQKSKKGWGHVKKARPEKFDYRQFQIDREDQEDQEDQEEEL
jgi:hypothetical protein